MGTPNITLPISEATAREITLVPTWRYANTYPAAMTIAEDSVKGISKDGTKIPDIRLLLTHGFDGPESVRAAFALAGTGTDGEGKLVIKAYVNFK